MLFICFAFIDQVKQPMFGANYIKGDVISEPEGKY